MSAISKQVIEQIRSRCDIVEVIGESVPLQRAGASYKALCPFHKEKTPSFHVNPQRQMFYCFGCHAGGDVFRFVMLRENVDFYTALRMLAEKTGVRIQFEDERESGPDKSLLYRIQAEAAEFYHELLLGGQGTAAREYLKSRDLGDQAVRDFMIGYAPNAWDALLKWAGKKGYATEALEAAGLVLRKSGASGDSGSSYDRFRNRVMFPICDEQGRVVGFSGRTLDDSDRSAKYVNTPDTALFHKSRILYALHRARQHILETREAIICEGQIDVIRCHLAGFRSAVAAQGTAFTEDHARLIRRYADGVVLVFDSDSAGMDATVRAAGVFLRAGLVVKASSVPAGEDPDSFIRKNGAEAFDAVLKSAVSPVAFHARMLARRENIRTESGILRAARAVLELIANSPDSVQRARLLDEAAAELGVPKSALEDNLRALVSRRQTLQEPGWANDGRTPAQTPGQEPDTRPAEKDLCVHLVQAADFPAMVRLVTDHLPLSMIADRRCRLFIEAAREAARRKTDIQAVLPSGEKADDSMSEFLAEILMSPPKAERRDGMLDRAVEEIILYLWRERLKEEKAELEKRLQAGGGTEEDEKKLCQLTHDIKALRSWEDGSLVIRMLMKP